ncbi:hypothetical protein [Nostocoides sp.]
MQPLRVAWHALCQDENALWRQQRGQQRHNRRFVRAVEQGVVADNGVESEVWGGLRTVSVSDRSIPTSPGQFQQQRQFVEAAFHHGGAFDGGQFVRCLAQSVGIAAAARQGIDAAFRHAAQRLPGEQARTRP